MVHSLSVGDDIAMAAKRERTGEDRNKQVLSKASVEYASAALWYRSTCRAYACADIPFNTLTRNSST